MVKKVSTTEQLERISGFACPKCQAEQVAELPANGISPHPGFRCLSCGAKLRGTTAMYLIVIVIGLALLAVATGMVTIFGDDRDQRLMEFVRGSSFAFFGWLSPWLPLYVFLVVFSVWQLLRPRPRRLSSSSS